MLINNKSLIKTINKLNLTDDEREKFNKISEDDRGNFLYNGKSIADISKENIIIDTYANIENIPSPYIGMIITVLEDETNNGKMTDYKVLSLKANNLGVANSVVDQVQRYVNYLGAGSSTSDSLTDGQLTTILNYVTDGVQIKYLTQSEYDALPEIDKNAEDIDYRIIDAEDYNPSNKEQLNKIGEDSNGNLTYNGNAVSGVSQESITTAVNNYLDRNPVTGGATAEEVKQLNANTNSIQMINNKFNLYYIPNESKCTEDTDKVNANWTTVQMYNAYDKLVEKYPKYIRKDIAPYKDSSGNYELRRYIFEPEGGYEKTIHVQAGVHGNEKSGMACLLRICQIICEEWQKHESIAYLRNKVRIVVIPIVNPWGRDNGSMNSYNVINLNRNYDGLWNKITGTNFASGDYPFSENEIKWVKDTIEWIGYENLHYGFDFHDAGSIENFGHYWINYNTFHEQSKTAVNRLVEYLCQRHNIENPNLWHVCDTNQYGVFPCWLNKTHGVPASTVESCYNVKDFSAEFMNTALEVYINTVIVNTLNEHTNNFEAEKNLEYLKLKWNSAATEKEFTASNDTTSYSDVGRLNLWKELCKKSKGYLNVSDFGWTDSKNISLNYFIASPKKYTKTIIIVGGNMLAATNSFRFQAAMYKLAQMLIENSSKNEFISKIKKNIRLIFIPVLDTGTIVNKDTYLCRAGNFSIDGTPSGDSICVNNLISILNNVNKYDGVIYSIEKTKANMQNDPTEIYATSATQSNKPYNYVEYLNTHTNVLAKLQDTSSELADYIWLQKNKPCVRIDSTIDLVEYELKKQQFTDSEATTILDYDSYCLLNYEVGRRISNIINVINELLSYEEGAISLTEPILPTSLSLNINEAKLLLNETITLIPELQPNNTTDKRVVYISSDQTIASVSKEGVVRRVGAGDATITCKTLDGSCSSTFTLKTESVTTINVESVALNTKSSELTIGQTLQLEANITPSNATNKNVTWTSDNNKCTVVDGLVTAVAEGVSVITCKTVDGNKTDTCTITVRSASTTVNVESVSLNTKSSELTVGQTLQLEANIVPSNATNKNVTWTSDNDKCTVVNGLVTARAEGVSIITCKTVDGNKTDTCTITVRSASTPSDTVTNYAYNTDTFDNPTTTSFPFANNLYYQTTGYLKNVSDGVMTLTVNNSTIGNCVFKHRFGTTENDNNKYYYRVKFKTNIENLTIAIPGTSMTNDSIVKNEWFLFSNVFSEPNYNSRIFKAILGDGTTVGQTMEIKEIMLINLTEIYGSGNEPNKEACDSTYANYIPGLIG